MAPIICPFRHPIRPNAADASSSTPTDWDRSAHRRHRAILLPSTQLVGTNAAPTVTIGGSTGGIIFSGLTPGFVGLYQVNVAIPTDAPTGTQTLKLSIGGQDATVNLVVQ